MSLNIGAPHTYWPGALSNVCSGAVTMLCGCGGLIDEHAGFKLILWNLELRLGKPPLIFRHNVATPGLPGDSAWAGTQDLRRGSGFKGDDPQHWCCWASFTFFVCSIRTDTNVAKRQIGEHVGMPSLAERHG